jgi:DNA polymerase III subunit alpha
MNVVADFYLHTKNRVWSKGMDFKPIFGCEFYFHPSFDRWEKESAEYKEQMKIATQEAKDSDGTDVSTVENEEESKQFNKNSWNPMNRRHHLVLLAQNEQGLKNLFRMNTYAHKHGYYRYPRIDFDVLKQHSNGVICTSACLAGIYSYELFKAEHDGLSEDATYAILKEHTEQFLEIFGKDRFFLEIQFNSIEKQHKLNAALVRLARDMKINLVAAADFHYPKLELFKAREIIKYNALAAKKFANLTIIGDVEDLECELYPKNARQMIEAYNEMDGGDYITQDEVLTAIKNSRRIADDLIDQFEIDTSPKLPKIYQGDTNVVLAEKIAEKLEYFFENGLIPMNQQEKYIEQAALELSVIQRKRFSDYFLTYERIMDAVKDEMLCAPGRGSGAGSLINYLLGITELDPIKYNLMFERFLDEYRTIVLPKMDMI